MWVIESHAGCVPFFSSRSTCENATHEAPSIQTWTNSHTSQLFRWRQQFAGPQAAETFVPVRIAPPAESGPQAPDSPTMTLVFSNGAHIEFRCTPAPAVIAQIVELLGGAGDR